MSGLLQGTAFITGAGSGIGQATAICMAQHGVTRFALGDIDLEKLAETKAALISHSSDVGVLLIELDVSKEDSVKEAVEKAVAKFGRIDYAVNNAGISGPIARTESVAFSDWQQLVSVNLNGVWLCQRSEILQMLKQDLRSTGPGSSSINSRGVIVNVASVLGIIGASGSSPVTAYSAAKHGVMGLTKTDARVYAKEGIRINAICPGFIETPLLMGTISDEGRKAIVKEIPADRLGKPEEIGSSIVYLMSHLSSFMYGHGLVVDGGQVCG
ncbi:hypothetical protein PV11_06190 [Exophiala sideris]|uniref:Uncharacterized protein n=1 Tax=Exophiala sideris TaxID=1016849 RepID=A0A0D1VRA0_9EURO|nr:hypothetical protein PV11_06190 [Exophiala sideris]